MSRFGRAAYLRSPPTSDAQKVRLRAPRSNFLTEPGHEQSGAFRGQRNHAHIWRLRSLPTLRRRRIAMSLNPLFKPVDGFSS